MKRILFALLLVLSIGFFAQAQDDTTPIAIGNTVDGELTEENPFVDYLFEASEGDSIIIDLSSDDFDTYLFLLDRDGIELTRDDDGGEGLNSRISGFTVPESGTYIIRAASYSYRDGGDEEDIRTGAYRLSLDLLEVTNIEYGQTLTGTSDGYIGLFQFTAEEGTTVSAMLTVDGNNYDTELVLSGPDGYELSYGNYVDGQTTTVGPYTLEEGGAYTLEATGSGDYSLSLERVEAIPVALGQSVTATFDERNQVLYFSYETDSFNQIVDFRVDSGNSLDTTMSVVGPYGYEYANNDDGEGTVDPELIAETLDDEGIYLITLRAQNPNARLNGDVLFTVRPSELPSLEDGTVTLSFDFENEDEILTFEGEAGETVRLTIEVVDGEDYATPYIELSQEGSPFANFNMNGVARLVADLEVPESGTVNVSVQSYSDITINITFERLAE